MASDPHSFDPYRSPSLPEGPYAGKPPSRRPGLLTALCAVAIVLGVLGLINAFIGGVVAAAGDRVQTIFQPGPTPGMTAEMQELQQDFQDDVNAINARHYYTIVAMLLFRFMTAVLLFLGGIQALGLKESGRVFLAIALGVATAFELTSGIFQTIVNLETMTAVNSFLERMRQEGAAEAMLMIVRGSIIAGIVLYYLLALAKLGLYVGGIFYLQKQHIRSLFKTAS